MRAIRHLSAMLILLGIHAGNARAQYAGEATVLSPSEERIGFGLSLAIRNDVLIVGAPFDTVSDSVSAGAVYVYRRTGPGAWTSEVRLTADDVVLSEDLFGSSVSLESYTDRDLAVVGSGSGAHVFQHDQGQWSRVQHLVGGQGRDSFGGSVSLSDSNLVASSSFDVPRGSISICRLSHDGLFEESARFEQQEVGFFIGQPSLVWGGTVVAGTDGYESYAGRVYSYRLSDNEWTFFEQLDTDDTVRVGVAIALRDSLVAIQGYDDGPCCEYVHLFQLGTDGWHSVARIEAPTEQVPRHSDRRSAYRSGSFSSDRVPTANRSCARVPSTCTTGRTRTGVKLPRLPRANSSNPPILVAVL